VNSLHTKLKRRLIAQYLIDVGGKDNMQPADWHRLGRGIIWRLRMVDNMAAMARRGQLDRQQFAQQLQAVSIRRQIEDDLTVYQEQLDELTEDLRDGEITEEEYESRVEELAIAILILAFLLGRNGDDEDNLGADERAIVAGAQAILSGSSRNAGAILTAFDALDIADDAKAQVNEAIELAIESAPNLGAYAPAATEQGVAARLGMWVNAGLGLYTVGQLWRDGDPFYRWNVSPGKQSCSDCLRLNGQVHRASEWANSGWRPKGSNLQCHGINCGCFYTDADGPSSGGF
jgi:hypothetical protein